MKEQMIVTKIERDVWSGETIMWKVHYKFEIGKSKHVLFWVAPDEMSAFAQLKVSRADRYEVVMGGE